MSIEDDLTLRLHAQFALLGQVTPLFRSVSLDIDVGERLIRARFIFDDTPGLTDRNAASVVATEIINHYSGLPGWMIDEEHLSMPVPQRMEHLRLLVFERA